MQRSTRRFKRLAAASASVSPSSTSTLTSFLHPGFSLEREKNRENIRKLYAFYFVYDNYIGWEPSVRRSLYTYILLVRRFRSHPQARSVTGGRRTPTGPSSDRETQLGFTHRCQHYVYLYCIRIWAGGEDRRGLLYGGRHLTFSSGNFRIHSMSCSNLLSNLKNILICKRYERFQTFRDDRICS